MGRMSRLTEIATLVVGATAIGAASQLLLMPEFYTWENEFVAAFLHGLPR